MSQKIMNPKLLTTIRNLNHQEIIKTPRLLTSVVDLDKELGEFEYHNDITRIVGLWRYEDPGDGRLLSVDKTVVRCNFASRTGVAFYQTQRVACFNIPELAAATDIWVKFDVYAYDYNNVSSKLRVYDATSGVTGVAFNPYNSSNSNCFNFWVNGTNKKSETRAFNGFHSMKFHFVSDATNGRMDFYFDNDITPYYTFTGNVNNGKPLSNLYIQCDNSKMLVSNLVICNLEPSISDVVQYEKESYKYINLGTADSLTVAGTTVNSTDKSTTGTGFYQTTQPTGGCFGVPMMDEAWIRFDLYHTSGTKRFRCYANAGNTTGVCLEQNSSNRVCIFTENSDSNTYAAKVVANTIQTYVVHMVSGSKNGKVEVWIDNEKVLNYTSSKVISPLGGLYLQSEDGSNVFSNVVISDSQANLTLPVRTMVDTHPDIIRAIQSHIEQHYDIEKTISAPVTSWEMDTHNDIRRIIQSHIECHYDIESTIFEPTGDWVYKDPGDGRILTSYSQYHNSAVRKVCCNFASRTGIGFTDAYGGFDKPELYSSKEVWVKFDAYLYHNYYPSVEEADSLDIEFAAGSHIAGMRIYNADMECTGRLDECGVYWGSNDDERPTIEQDLSGLHSYLVHVKSDATNGCVELYIDSDNTPVCVHTGNINQGECFSKCSFFTNEDVIIISNIVISNTKPNITEVVTYQKQNYKYENLGVLDDDVTNAEVIESTEYSNTGSALKLLDLDTQILLSRDYIYADEIWIKFDLYRLQDGTDDFFCVAYFSKQGAAGMVVISDGTVCIGDNQGNTYYRSNFKISKGKLYTCIVHLSSLASQLATQIWLDDELIIDNTRTYGACHPFMSVNMASGYYEPVALFSNITISNQENIVRGIMPEGYTECNYDIRRESFANITRHFDIRRDPIDFTQTRYENPGIPDSGGKELCTFTSRTKVGMYPAPHEAKWDRTINPTNEIWVMLDVFAWDEMNLYHPYNPCVSISAKSKDSFCTVGTYFCSEKKDTHKIGFVVSRKDEGSTPSAKCDMDKLIGFHTIRAHFVTRGTTGVEVFLDDNTTASCYFLGEVNLGQDISSVSISLSGEYLTVSNIIIDESEPSVDEVVSYSASPYTPYTNLGRVENLTSKTTVHGATVKTTTKSRTGVAFYQTERTRCLDILPVDDMWLQFDLYHHEDAPFYCLVTPMNIGLQLKSGTTNQAELVLGTTVLSTIDILPDTIQTYLLHLQADPTKGKVQLWIDNQQVVNTTINHGVGYFDNVCFQSANEDNLFSNITVANEELTSDSHGETHFDIKYFLGNYEESHFDTEYLVVDDSSKIPIEGIATHKTIDLGAELTVGIGITLDGEGYAMIRTAGESMRFTEWKNYIPCERLCRYIDVRLYVRNAITKAVLTVDRRTISKTISKHLSAGENVIEYGEAFYNVPTVIPTAIGDGVTASVISKNKESCVIKITNSDNQAVEGDVDVLIRGW